MNAHNPFSILFEDTDVLAISKPAGVVVNEAVSAVGETVQEWARQYLASQPDQSKTSWLEMIAPDFDPQYGTPEEIFVQRAGMVHRLDKETSGVLLWAKNPGAQVELLRQFRERVVTKTYDSLVHGAVATASGEITAPIDRSSYNRQRFAVAVDGRPAVTAYEVIARYTLDFDRFISAARQAHLFAGRPAAQLKEHLTDYLDYTYLKCQPKTGRTHQIRVHCQHIGHPLVGDELYQGRKRIKLDEIWCQRHFLHAGSITFAHPRTQESLTLSAPLPADLLQSLEWLHATSL